MYISHKTKGCDIWPPLKSQFRKAVVGWEHCVIFILVAQCINNIHQYFIRIQTANSITKIIKYYALFT